ncbi:MAG: hypothetical protein ACOYT9_00920 [Patescibacteria group bacterium]
MNREKYEEAKKASQEIDRLLKEGNLTPEERQKFEKIRAQLAGVLLSPWLPVDWGRRSIMFFIFLIGLYGMIQGHTFLASLWLLLPIFSPRIVGEVAYALGKIFRK